jgi:hypothetical protein
MANTYTWNIVNLERHTLTGIVYTIHWTVDARSKNNAYSAGAYGSVELAAPGGDAIIPYADLTPEIVTGWLLDRFGEEKVGSILEALDAQIAEQQAPTKAAGLPWR